MIWLKKYNPLKAYHAWLYSEKWPCCDITDLLRHSVCIISSTFWRGREVIAIYPEDPISPELQQHSREYLTKRSKDSARVVLFIHSSNLSANEISKILDIESEDTLSKGVKILKGDNPISWTLSSRRFVKSNFVGYHLKWLLDAIYDKRLSIAKLKSLNCDIKARVILKNWTGIDHAEICPEMMSRFAQFKIPLHVIFRYMDLERIDTVWV